MDGRQLEWRKPALTILDNVNTCGHNVGDDAKRSRLQKAYYQRIAIDADSVVATVVFGVRELTDAQALACTQIRDRDHLPADVFPVMKSYEVRFQWDGRRLRPTPESIAIKALVEGGR